MPKIISYCSEPSSVARLFIRPGLGYMCLAGKPDDIELVYRVVSYASTGERSLHELPPPEQSCHLIRATRYHQPDLVLREGRLLSFGGEKFARLTSLRLPWWRTGIRLEHTETVGELPATPTYLLTYLQLEEEDPATVTDGMREHALQLLPSPVYF